MGIAKNPNKVLLVITVFSKSEQLIEKSKKVLEKKFGEVGKESSIFNFNETNFYEKEMGSDLKLQIFGFKKFISPIKLANIKVITNKLEKKLHKFAKKHLNIDKNISRSINLDPGYITPNKFVLATTKDASHRIYLKKGIYAEATLSYMHKAWKEHSYTYLNYKNKAYQDFLTILRDYLKNKYKKD